MKKSKKKEKAPFVKIFTVLYIVEFLGAAIIGILSNSYFAYNIFNSLWADILYIICLALLYITAFVQEVLALRKVSDIVANGFIFLGSALLCVLAFTVGGVFILFLPIYSAVTAGIIAVRYALTVRTGIEPDTDTKQFVAVASLLLFAMTYPLSMSFVDESYFAWSLIPASVITIFVLLAAFLILKDNLAAILNTSLKRIGYCILMILCTFVIAFMYCYPTLTIINRMFDGDPVPTEYVVLEKKIRSGSRQVTTHELKVNIDGNEKWIDVPVTDYYNINEGDTVIVNYHKGALGFAYYAYYDKK